MVKRVADAPRRAPKPVPQQKDVDTRAGKSSVETKSTDTAAAREARRAARRQARELTRDQYGRAVDQRWDEEISLAKRSPLREEAGAKLDPNQGSFWDRYRARMALWDRGAMQSQPASRAIERGVSAAQLGSRLQAAKHGVGGSAVPELQQAQARSRTSAATATLQTAPATAARAPVAVTKGIRSSAQGSAASSTVANRVSARAVDQSGAGTAAANKAKAKVESQAAASQQSGPTGAVQQTSSTAASGAAAAAGSGAPRADYSDVQLTLPQPPNDPNFVAEPWRTCEAFPHIAGESALAKPQDVVAGHPPGQAFMRWDEETVNQMEAYGQQTGAVNSEISADAASVGRELVGVPKGEQASGPAQQISPEALSKALCDRIPPERLAPTQIAGALQYINGATDAADQVSRIRKSIQAFQTMDKAGTPPVTRRQMIEELWSKGDMKVPGHALEKLGNAELKEKYDQINGLRYVPGEHEVKLGSDRTYKMKVDDNGQLQSETVDKKGFWSKVGGFVKKAAGFALTAASFIPGPIGIAARIGNAVYSAYQGAKNGRIGQAIAGIAGGVAAGAGAIAGKAAGTVAQVASGVQRIASGVQAGLDAYKYRNAGGVLGAIAGVASGAAGLAADGAGAFANTMDDIATWAGRGSIAANAVDAARRGDVLGALGAGTELASQLAGGGGGSDSLRTIASGAQTAAHIQQALRSGDYSAAAAAASGFASHSVSDRGLAKNLHQAAAVFSGASAIQSAVKGGDWLSAANAASQVAATLSDNQDVRNAARVLNGADFLKQAIDSGDDFAMGQAAALLGKTVQEVAQDTYQRHFNKPEVIRHDVQPKRQAGEADETADDGEGSSVGGSGEAGETAAVRSDGVPVDQDGRPVAPPTWQYQVKSGDALERIAAANNLSVQDLLAANPDINDPNKIYVGQVLNVPYETGYAEAARQLAEFRARNPYGVVDTRNPTHTVQPGDTLTGLAQKYGISEHDLRRINPQIDAEGRLYVGQQLNLMDLSDPALHNNELKDGPPYYQNQRFDGPLFRDGASPEDPMQGYLGDCYLLSAAMATAKTNPGQLERMITDNRDGTYTVTFKEWDDQKNRYIDRPITVDGDLPSSPQQGNPLYGRSRGDQTRSEMELWAPILEKAYAEYKGSSYNSIGSGGYGKDVLEALYGQQAESMYVGNKPDDGWRALTAAIDDNRPLGASTYEEKKIPDAKNNGIVPGHAYSVEGYAEINGDRYVTLRNPWGFREPGNDGRDDGLFTVKYEDFLKYYGWIWGTK